MDALIKNIASERAVIKEEISLIEDSISVMLAEVAVAQAKINALHDDLGRLDKAEAALRGQPLTVFKSVTPPKNGPPTIKKMIIAVLKDHPEGLTANNILSKVNARFSKSYSRTSLSPQLSRLFKAGEIMKISKNWILYEYYKKPMTRDPRDQPMLDDYIDEIMADEVRREGI